MKRTKRTVVIAASLSIILTLTAIVCIVSFTGKADSDRYEPARTEILDDVEKTKTMELLGADKINQSNGMLIDGAKLTYKETVTYSSDVSYDIYIDKSGNEYKYNKLGVLREININAIYSDAQGTYGSYDSAISEETASELAVKVEVLPNGGLRSCYMTEQYENIEKILKDVKKQEIYDYIEQKLQALGNTIQSYEVYAIDFKKVNDKYLLEITVFVDWEDGYGTNETYFYPLS